MQARPNMSSPVLIMVCYFKNICGINQAEDRVTWPYLLHRHTSALASFREWSVVAAWLRIRAQPRNPCQSRNSASASTCKCVTVTHSQSCAMPPLRVTIRQRVLSNIICPKLGISKFSFNTITQMLRYIKYYNTWNSDPLTCQSQSGESLSLHLGSKIKIIVWSQKQFDTKEVIFNIYQVTTFWRSPIWLGWH